MSVTGTGTRTDPYVITTYADFQNLTQNVTSEPYIKLANAIDLNYTSWTSMWTRGNRPNAHVDMNGYGFYHVVVHGTNLVNYTTESHLFCAAEFYNGTIDVHSSPTDTLPTTDMSWYQMQQHSFQGNLTDTDTTFTKVKFTGMLNVGLTLYHHAESASDTTKAKYYVSIFRGMFNYCVFDMDINLSSSHYAYSHETYDYDITLGEQDIFSPTMCQTIYNIYKYYINDYLYREDDLDFDMANCDINLRLNHLGCYGHYEGADHSPVHIFKRFNNNIIEIQNCRIRGSLQCADLVSLNGFIYQTTGYAYSGSGKLYNVLVNFDFRRCSAPPLSRSFSGWDLIDAPASPSGTPALYVNDVINADYLRYRRLHGAVTCRNFTNCTTDEIINGATLRTKGFPVVNL